MIYLFISILSIMIGFIIVTNQQKKIQSTTSECSICHNLFPETEIFTSDELPFCSEHIQVYEEANWIPYMKAISTPQESLEGIHLFEKKVNLWRNYKIPTVIKSSYEINGEEIITKLTLFVRKSDLEAIKKVQ